MLRTLLLTVALAALGSPLVSCGNRARVHAGNVDHPALESHTYAWVDERIDGPVSATSADSELVTEAKGLLSAELARRGMQPALESDAGLLLALRLDTTVDIRQFDPYFAIYSLERFEKGHLTLAALAPVSYEELWRASQSRTLRVTERAMSRARPVWEPHDEDPDWDLESLVDDVLDAFPSVD